MGMVLGFTNRAVQSIAEYERALALDRNLAGAHALIGQSKLLIGRGEETEAHVQEALRLSPRDRWVYTYLVIVGLAKSVLGRPQEAVSWLSRSIESNRNYPLCHFGLAAALANLGRIDEARSEVRAGLALDPHFTIARFESTEWSDNPVYLAQRTQFIDGMRKAGVPTREFNLQSGMQSVVAALVTRSSAAELPPHSPAATDIQNGSVGPGAPVPKEATKTSVRYRANVVKPIHPRFLAS
jgi:tetratricopeptide (TPR) repeat protein